MPDIYMIETHDQVLAFWRAKKMVSLQILHLDFHCDMRGLLIDRKNQRAYPVPALKQTADPGNFLTHAITEDRLVSVRWVHGEPGGRRDDVGTVKYETDISAYPVQLFFSLSRKKGLPIHYKEIIYKDWKGTETKEFLDIDWDFFASIDYPSDSIYGRVNEFLSRDFQFIPDQTYICYSKDFSHPSRDQWKDFGDKLAKRFGATIQYLPPEVEDNASQPFYKRYLNQSTFRVLRNFYHSICLWLHRHGIY